jgi:hypothetical protein
MFLNIILLFIFFFSILITFTIFLEFIWSKEKLEENILETLEQNIETKKIRQKPTLQDGNCFYSAIYRSLLEKDLIDELANKLNLNLENEITFILSLRYFLSTNPLFIRNYQDLFYNMVLNFQDKEFLETFKYILFEFADTRYVLIKFYRENKFKNEYLGEFIEDIQKIIQTDGTFVGEIEVNTLVSIVKESLNEESSKFNSNIDVMIFNNEEKANLFAINKSYEEKSNLLILLLENEHWTYL